MRMNHLHLKSHDFDATRRFYEKNFGFKKAFDHQGAAFLMDEAGFLLAIFEYEKGQARTSFPEWYHHGFCLTEEHQVRDLYAQMRRDGVEFSRQLKEWQDGAVNFYCYDPAGYKVEVSWHPEEARLLRQRQQGDLIAAR
jgi:catechol 2,3-dioxygenase-like lactoylglutathione lyase family enzyme